MAQLVQRRLRGRYNQPKLPSPLPSPPPMPGGDHEPTSLFRRPDLILLPDGRQISIYEGRHGDLVTDTIGGSTRPVEDVYMEVLYDLQKGHRDLPPLIAEPVRRRHRGRDAHKLPIRCILPGNRTIHAYNDRHGVLVTDDMDVSIRRVEDVYMQVLYDLQTGHRDPPPLIAEPVRRRHRCRDAHKTLFLCLLPDGRIIHAYNDSDGFLVTEDMDGLTRPVRDVFREVLLDLWTRPSHPPRPVVDAAEEDQPAAQQTATPSPGPSGAQFVDDPLNRHCVAHKLKLAQRREDREPNVLASKELLDTTTLEESITNASSLLQPIPREDREPNVLASKELLHTTTLESISNASSLPQPAPREDREPNVLASKELLDTTTLESITNASSLSQPAPHEDREPNVLASKELLDATTLESSISNASSLPQPTLPLKEELFLTPQLLQALNKGRASYELWPTQQPSGSDMLSSKELLIVKATLGKSSIMDASSTREEAVTHSLTPPISARKPAGWNHQFFIRVDLNKVFHTYPKLSGPFWSLEEAEKAILHRLDELRDPKMCTNNGLSRSEIAIRDALHWPDGTKKYSSRSNPDRDHMDLLVQALLDKYNEENKLLGDHAYHLEKVVSFQEVYEGNGGWYYHLNCTRKTKGGVDNLFFAEVLKMIRGRLNEFELTCLHMVEPDVDNGPCYGCKEDNVGMKHPIHAGKYKGGHDPSWPRCSGVFPLGLPKDVNARMKDMEERIRNLFQDRDVVKSDAGTVAADASMNKGRIRYIYRDGHLAKSDARRTAAGLEGKRGKYVVPARRQLV